MNQCTQEILKIKDSDGNDMDVYMLKANSKKDIPVLSSTHGTDGKLISIPEIDWKLDLFPGQEITQK